MPFLLFHFGFPSLTNAWIFKLTDSVSAGFEGPSCSFPIHSFYIDMHLWKQSKAVITAPLKILTVAPFLSTRGHIRSKKQNPIPLPFILNHAVATHSASLRQNYCTAIVTLFLSTDAGEKRNMTCKATNDASLPFFTEMPLNSITKH